jgi:hypothetical protein
MEWALEMHRILEVRTRSRDSPEEDNDPVSAERRFEERG